MNHPRIPTPILEHARRLLPTAQYEAWTFYELGQTMQPPRGIRWVASQLDLDPSSVNGRLTRAARNLKNAGIMQDASGNWHQTPSVRAQDGFCGADSVKTGVHPNPSVETRGNAYRKDAA